MTREDQLRRPERWLLSLVVARGLATISAPITLRRRNGIWTISDGPGPPEATLGRSAYGSATLRTGSRRREQRVRWALRSWSSRSSRNRQLAAATTPRGKSSRAGAIAGQQGCCDIPTRPSFALPGSTPVIPSSTAADLPNRQGPCLRNPSACTPPPSVKRLFPAVTVFPGNRTLTYMRAVTTRGASVCVTTPR